MLLSILVFLASGAVAGIMAGLLGVGGGIVIVPMLAAIFPLLNIPAHHIQHIALATSLATIMMTSIASARTHYKNGAVRIDIFKKITPGILLGTFLGGIWAASIPHTFLKFFFVIFLYFVAVQMLINFKPKPQRQLPNKVGYLCVGSGIGLLSSFVGIGGGTMSVPFMTFCNVPMHTAVGTSAAIGFPIAVAGTLGYIVGGFSIPDLPSGSLGFVYLPAFMGIALASFCTAPIGARLAHKLPVSTLKKIFAVFLFVIATRMLIQII